MRSKFLRLGLALALSLLALAFTTLPGYTPLVNGASRLLGGTDMTDALGHVVLQCLFTAAWFWALSLYLSKKAALLSAISIAIAFGTLTEFAQRYVPERGSTLLDLGANWSGVIAFVLVLRWRSKEIF
jgi:VanZ family protein